MNPIVKGNSGWKKLIQIQLWWLVTNAAERFCVHLLFPKLYFCFVNLVNAVKWRQGRGRGRREIMLIRPPWSMFAPSMVLPLETLQPGLWPKVKFHSKRALVTMDGWLYRVFQKNALWECCWSHSALLAQSQVASIPCVWNLTFWSVLT